MTTDLQHSISCMPTAAVEIEQDDASQKAKTMDDQIVIMNQADDIANDDQEIIERVRKI